jgi:hypothetical protein
MIKQHSVGFGLGTLMTSIVALGLVAVGTGHKAWWLSDLPSWLEGLGTVAACVVALVLFGKWREQEAAKRRAEAAEKTLRAAFVLGKLVRDSRLSAPIKKDTAQGDVLMATAVMYVSLRGAKVAASAAPAAELQSYQSVARIYFGKKAAEAIDNLLRVQD